MKFLSTFVIAAFGLMNLAYAGEGMTTTHAKKKMHKDTKVEMKSDAVHATGEMKSETTPTAHGEKPAIKRVKGRSHKKAEEKKEGKYVEEKKEEAPKK